MSSYGSEDSGIANCNVFLRPGKERHDGEGASVNTHVAKSFIWRIRGAEIAGEAGGHYSGI